MYVLDDIISFLLRLGELAFAAVVAGLTGYYLNSVSDLSDWSQARFIYTEVVAALSILLALVWLFPFSGTFFFWPIDFLISIAWFVAFGLLVDFFEPLYCRGDITQQGVCRRWQADIAFTFLSAIFWLASALLGLWVMRRARIAPGRRWYRSRV